MIFRDIHRSVNVTMRGNITHVSFNSEKISTVILLSSSLLVLEMQTCPKQLPVSPFSHCIPPPPPLSLPVHKLDRARPGGMDRARGKVTSIRPAQLCHSRWKGQVCSHSIFGPKTLWPLNSGCIPRMKYWVLLTALLKSWWFQGGTTHQILNLKVEASVSCTSTKVCIDV